MTSPDMSDLETAHVLDQMAREADARFEKSLPPSLLESYRRHQHEWVELQAAFSRACTSETSEEVSQFARHVALNVIHVMLERAAWAKQRVEFTMRDLPTYRFKVDR